MASGHIIALEIDPRMLDNTLTWSSGEMLSSMEAYCGIYCCADPDEVEPQPTMTANSSF